jgi:hypothetical protein
LNLKIDEDIKLSKRYKTMFSLSFKEFIYYKWDDLPNKNKTNYIRHILFHFYPKECLDIYENALNLNIGYYIDKNKEKISYEIANDLISK